MTKLFSLGKSFSHLKHRVGTCPPTYVVGFVYPAGLMVQGSRPSQEFLDHTAELRTGAELGISTPTLLRPAVERLETSGS